MKTEVIVKGTLDYEPAEITRLKEGTPDVVAMELAEHSDNLTADFRELPEEEAE